MVKAIVIHEHGGPDVMKWEDVEVGEPGPGEARVRHEAIGPDARYISTMETSTAAIITSMSSAIPIAVRIESIENTMSITTI